MLGQINGMCLRLSGLIACLALALFTACSSEPVFDEERKPTYPVKGQVFVGDKPAVGAFVLFYPENEPAEHKDPRPGAEVGADGTFIVRTYGADDGAPAGDYRVTITWDGGPDEPDKLQGRYSDPATSQFKVTVKEGPNELEPFRLK